MTPAERQRAIDRLHETRGNLLRTAKDLSPTQLQYKPAPDRWSVAECIEHITIVENSILGAIEKTLLQPAASSVPAMGDDGLLQAVADRTTRVKGPDRLMPTGRLPHDRLVPEFRTARGRTLDFAGNISADLRQYGFPHPMFGHLDCYQWFLLVAAHGERHRAQAEEVMADAGFPSTAAAR